MQHSINLSKACLVCISGSIEGTKGLIYILKVLTFNNCQLTASVRLDLYAENEQFFRNC